MSVDPRISLGIIKAELAECEEKRVLFAWEFSPIDEATQTFMVTMKSPIDGEQYLLEVKFDDYREHPLLLEFVHPITKQRGVPSAYPAPSRGHSGGFFHNKPGICHPCSRNAYAGYTALHANWKMSNWEKTTGVGSLRTLKTIFIAIWTRISDPEIYNGRMHG